MDQASVELTPGTLPRWLRRQIARDLGRPFQPLTPRNHFRRLIKRVEEANDAQRRLLAAQQGGNLPALETAKIHADRAHERLTGYRSRGHGRPRYEPQYNRQAMRSKYVPHQGVQERVRRLIGGWAFHQRRGDFYVPEVPHTKNATLGTGNGRPAAASRLIEAVMSA